MSTAAIPRGNEIVFRSSSGAQERGSVISLTRDELIFEVYTPHLEITREKAIPNLTIYRGGHAIYSGGVAVSSVMPSERMLTVAAKPLGVWSGEHSLIPGARLREAARGLVREWQEREALQPAFQLAVVKLRSFLFELSRWIGGMDLMELSESPQGLPAPQADVAEEVFAVVHPQLQKQFAEFEHAARCIPPELWDAHRSFTQHELHPLTLCAPFVYRTYSKPLGYAGDYEMVNMILRNRAEGPSIFARIVNAYFLRIDVAQGHRNRIDRLTDTLNSEAARVTARGRSFKVLNIGCGPAAEVVRFIRGSELSSRCEFTLLDFNRQTLDYASGQLREAAMAGGRTVALKFVQQSVVDLLKDAARGRSRVAAEGYDFVYCAGLFDYLSDKVCSRLLELMVAQALPGGLVTATNVHPSHTSHAALDALGEWRLILRSEADMRRLAPATASTERAATEPAGTNVFLELRKKTEVHDGSASTIRPRPAD